ncbi:MAG TPA: 6-phosphofructokinase [Candidatus Brocadiia bacterium]|nr:6-phosphofructokinase [Candidatus Brocadiia bacterium]
MSRLKGNCVVAQSGGPTTVINASLCGVIQEAMRQDCIREIYAGYNGILGVLNEQLLDIGGQDRQTIAGLKVCPAAAAGSCRHKLSKDPKSGEYERILEIFRAHDVRYFFYCGGNDSMDTADKVSKLANQTGYELIVMGVPKTIDNDLAYTDHCPGYGSVAKYLATMVMESGRDTEALYTHDTCTIMEAMGRNAGWIAGSTGMAARELDDAPHLIYFPEAPVTRDKIVDDVRRVHARLGRVFIVVCEGVKDDKGNYLAEAGGDFGQDSFGHKQLGGAAEALRGIVEKDCRIKARTNKPGTLQRNGAHFASLTDVEEAYMCGAKAVQMAAEGTSGYMITLVRDPESKTYGCTTGLAKLSDVANGEKKVPREWINKDGNHITDEFRKYAMPLMKGEAPITIGDDGLPVYVRLEKRIVAQKCAKWTGPGKM